MRSNEGELSEGVGGTFGRLTLFTTATLKSCISGQLLAVPKDNPHNTRPRP